MKQLIDFHAPEVQAVLDTLLKDRSTGKNIIWATDPPDELQTVMYEPVTDRSQITTQQLGLTHYEVAPWASLFDTMVYKSPFESAVSSILRFGPMFLGKISHSLA